MQSETPLIGIVGLPGSGKSTLARSMAELGAVIIDADREGHGILNDSSIRGRLRDEFHVQVSDSGAVDRRVLADIVTRDQTSMERFNRIIHPYLLARVADRIERIYRNTPGMVPVVDAALIPEWGIASFFDLLIYVHCPKHMRIRRLKATGKDMVAMERLESYQNPEHVKRALCHVVVDNMGTRGELEKRGAALIRCIRDTRGKDKGEKLCRKRLWTISGMHRND